MDNAYGDRGSRVTIPQNYFDGGDPRQKPRYAADVPAAVHGVLAVSVSGWVGALRLGDGSFAQHGALDRRTDQARVSHGCVTLWRLLLSTRVPTLAFDQRVFEAHIFDPTHLGEAIRGQRQPYAVKPASLGALNLPGMGFPWGGNSPTGNIAGAT